MSTEKRDDEILNNLSLLARSAGWKDEFVPMLHKRIAEIDQTMRGGGAKDFEDYKKLVELRQIYEDLIKFPTTQRELIMARNQKTATHKRDH